MKPALDELWPRPKHAELTEERWDLEAAPTWIARGSKVLIDPPTARLERGLRQHGLRPHQGLDSAQIELGLDPAALPPQGYRLRIGPRGARLEGADRAGLHHAVATFLQWLFLHGDPSGEGRAAQIEGLAVVDSPDFAHRGVVLDVSRNKVPTMATLRELVEMLAGWKVNQLQLYTEHTFAYRGHETVWRHASPLTPEETRELDAFCRARGIELVPNQNSFGHFHRWLVHEPYRRLAECPEGIEHPFSLEPEPFSLCPVDPGSLELLADLYDQLLPNFSSGMFNVGLDETLDLGRGRSAAACAERGKARVYLDFLRQVHALVGKHGRRMQFWGDVILQHPELLGELPRDAIALEWGYEADHPFDEDAARFAASGLDFYVCPGTSSWNSLAGRSTNALGNLASAARNGREHGALGYLVTDWGDHGHLQPLPVSYPGLLAGSGLAWNVDGTSPPIHKQTIARLLDRHVFRDATGRIGGAFVRLGDVYRHTGVSYPNGSALFFLLAFPHYSLDHERLRGLHPEGLERVRAEIEAAKAEARGTRMARSDAEQIVRELTWTADALDLAARIGLERLKHDPSAQLVALDRKTRLAFAAELAELVTRRRTIWLARHRPGGLKASLARLERTRDFLLG